MPKPTLFFTRTFNETRELLSEARDYLAYIAEDDLEVVSLNDRLIFALESSRLTACLVNIMSWLLLQRAVQAGEIAEHEAVADGPDLGERARVLAEPATGPLPPMMTELLERSQKLYIRVARLDDMVRRKIL